jgi:hypothetical protein
MSATKTASHEYCSAHICVFQHICEQSTLRGIMGQVTAGYVYSSSFASCAEFLDVMAAACGSQACLCTTRIEWHAMHVTCTVNAFHI